MKCEGWFLSDGELILCRRGCDKLIPVTRRGIPRGAISFASEEEATREAEAMARIGFWPLFHPKAVFLRW